MSDESGSSDLNARLERELVTRLGGRGLAVRAVPVFDLRKGTATSFVCGPSRAGADGNAFGHWLLEALDEDVLAALDLQMLDVMVGYATRFSDAKLTASIACTVALSTLKNPRSRKVYLDKLVAAKQTTDTPLLIKVELIPPGTPAIRLSEVLSYLRALVRFIFVSIDHVQDLSTWGPGTVGAVGLGLMLKADDDAAAAREKASWLSALCVSQGAMSFVDGIATPEIAKAVAQQNVRLGTGPAFCLALFSMSGGLAKVPLAAR